VPDCENLTSKALRCCCCCC